MAHVLNRTTQEYRRSVNTPDFDPATWAINPSGVDVLIAAGVPSREWFLEADNSVREMTGAEKDAAFLPDRKGAKLSRMKDEVTGYISGKYDLGQQITLLALWAEGIDKVFPSRKSKVHAILDWVNMVLDRFYERKNAVLAATTIPDVESVALDLSQFDATAPSLTIEEVKNTSV